MDNSLMEEYEKYLDEEILAEINEEDNKEDVDNKVHKKKIHCRYPKEMQITIKEYVHDYLGLYYVNCDNLWHAGLKELGSDLIFGIDNEYANKNPETVYRGEVLLVRDERGNVGTYINPKLLVRLFELDDLEKKLEGKIKDGVHILSELNDYMQSWQTYNSLKETQNGYKEFLEETHKLRKYKRLKKENRYD